MITQIVNLAEKDNQIKMKTGQIKQTDLVPGKKKRLKLKRRKENRIGLCCKLLNMYHTQRLKRNNKAGKNKLKATTC